MRGTTKILIFVLSMPFFLSIGFAQASCNDVVQGAVHDGIPNSSNKLNDNLQKAFHELAMMAIHNDTVTKNDEPSGLNMLLEKEFNETRQEFLDRVLSLGLMTKDQFEARLAAEVSSLQNHQAEKEQANSVIEKQQNDSLLLLEPDGSQAIFGSIEGGSFLMGAEGKQVLTAVSSFGMMETLMTNIVWDRILELAVLQLNGKFNGLKTMGRSVKSDLEAKTEVSWEDAQLWIQALNQLSRLDLPELREIIPQHQIGDVYRLPTEAEWEFVARGRGALTGTFAVPPEEIDSFAWHANNLPSSEDLPDVARKKPLIIGAFRFFDMFGYVAEMTKGRVDSAIFSQSPVDGPSFVSRGASYRYSQDQLYIAWRSSVLVSSKSLALGFRLVRERAER